MIKMQSRLSSCSKTSTQPEQIELTRLNSSRNMNSTNEDSSSSGKIDRVIVLTDFHLHPLGSFFSQSLATIDSNGSGDEASSSSSGSSSSKDSSLLASSTLCRCPDCRPPGFWQRIWQTVIHRGSGSHRRSAGGGKGKTFPIVCVNAGRFVRAAVDSGDVWGYHGGVDGIYRNVQPRGR